MENLITSGIYSVGLGVDRDKYAVFVIVGQNHNTVVGFEVHNIDENINSQSKIVEIVSDILKKSDFKMGTIFDVSIKTFKKLTSGFMGILPDEEFEQLKTIARTRYSWI